MFNDYSNAYYHYIVSSNTCNADADCGADADGNNEVCGQTGASNDNDIGVCGKINLSGH